MYTSTYEMFGKLRNPFQVFNTALEQGEIKLATFGRDNIFFQTRNGIK